jgi:hypothetical protein
MIIDLATEPNVAIFREPHVSGLVVHIPKGQELHQRPSRRLRDGAALPFDETVFRERGCCRVEAHRRQGEGTHHYCSGVRQ